MTKFLMESAESAVPVTPLSAETFGEWADGQDAALRTWMDSTGFSAKPGSVCLVAGGDGSLAQVLFGVPEEADLWDWARLPASLPHGDYRIDPEPDGDAADAAALGWALASYRFDRYRPDDSPQSRLVWPAPADREFVINAASATTLVRDLINTPAEDMGPPHLADAAREVAEREGAAITVIEGEDLLSRNFPAVHAVGRAHDRAPRLVDLTWGEASAPKVTIVGKGVCFDTGGLDLKTAAGMKLMKKDMGGGAHAIGLAAMVMAAKLPVRLRLLVPAVENSVSANALRPLDVVNTRKGLTIEIGNTDAEGRVILADALAEAASESPDVIIDYATLTGAARVALGTELPALYSNDDAWAADILAAGGAVADPLWRMPLWQEYAEMVKGKVADLTNSPEDGYGGSITAALFLERFVEPDIPWVHMDIMAWNLKNRPGRPEGGEAMGMRAVFEALKTRYETA